jgi:hypothetical protein
LPDKRLPTVCGGLNQQLEPSSLRAEGVVISVAKRADERLIDLEARTQDLREKVVARIIPVFIGMNLTTVAVIGLLAGFDEVNIGLHSITPDGRVITPQVIMSLLAASAVQLGSIAVIISKYLFTYRNDTDDRSEVSR